MGKMSRTKGNRVERRIVNDLRAAGIPARRVPLSGATEYAKGDIQFMPFSAPPMIQNIPSAEFDWDHAMRNGDFGLVAEVKARKEFPKWLTEYLGSNDALFLVEDRQEPLVVMRLSKFTELVG